MGAVPSHPKGKTALSLQSFVFMWNPRRLKVPRGPPGVGAGAKERDPLQRPEKEGSGLLELWSHVEELSTHIFNSAWPGFVHDSGPAPGLLSFASAFTELAMQWFKTGNVILTSFPTLRKC